MDQMIGIVSGITRKQIVQNKDKLKFLIFQGEPLKPIGGQCKTITTKAQQGPGPDSYLDYRDYREQEGQEGY